MKVSREGLLGKGDKIKIVGRSEKDSQEVTVKSVINVNGKEEVIINKNKNKYFITSMVISGESWVHSVLIVKHKKPLLDYSLVVVAALSKDLIDDICSLRVCSTDETLSYANRVRCTNTP